MKMSLERFTYGLDELLHKIDPDSIVFTGKLKEGNFSIIHTALYQEGGNRGRKNVAAKEYKGNDQEEKNKSYLHDIRELQLLKRGNDYLVKIIGMYQAKDQFYTIMNLEVLLIEGEIMNDLLAYLIYIRSKCKLKNMQLLENVKKEDLIDLSSLLRVEDLHTFAYQIAGGCAYLENNKIIHGDLAVRNILIDQNKNIKITDYGFLNVKKHLLDFKDLCGFPYYRWAAPEVILSRQYSLRSDVWSFGIVLWEIGTLGAFPYGDLKDDQYRKLREDEWKNKKSSIREPQPNNRKDFIEFFTENVKRVMKDCWHKETRKRPSFLEILQKLDIANKCPNPKNCSFFKNLESIKKNMEFLETKADLDAKKYVSIGTFHENMFSGMNPVGRGTFGEVKKLRVGNDVLWQNKDMAVKILDSVPLDDAEYESRSRCFLREIYEFEKLGNHENIVEIISIYDMPMSIMMEYHSLHLDDDRIILTSLDKYLKYLRQQLRKEIDINSQELGWFAIQIARGMDHLEKHEITHSNLTARNVLINNAKILKITDFGYQGQWFYKSKSKESKELELSNCWAAPEIVLNNKYSSKSDVWAFGVVLWEIGTLAEHPVGNYRKEELVKLINKRSYVGMLSRKGTISIDLWEIMLPCWYGNPELRPDFKKLLLELSSLRAKQNIYLDFTSEYSLGPTKEKLLQIEEQQDSACALPPPPSPPLPPPPASPSPPRTLERRVRPSLSFPDYSTSFPPGPSGSRGQYFPQNLTSHRSQGSVNQPVEYYESTENVSTQTGAYRSLPRKFSSLETRCPSKKSPTILRFWPPSFKNRSAYQPPASKTPTKSKTLPRDWEKAESFEFVATSTPTRPALDSRFQHSHQTFLQVRPPVILRQSSMFHEQTVPAMSTQGTSLFRFQGNKGVRFNFPNRHGDNTNSICKKCGKDFNACRCTK